MNKINQRKIRREHIILVYEFKLNIPEKLLIIYKKLIG